MSGICDSSVDCTLHRSCLISRDRDTNVLWMWSFAILGVRRYIEFGGSGGCSEQSSPPMDLGISCGVSPCVVGINAYANMAEPSGSLSIERNIRRMRLILCPVALELESFCCWSDPSSSLFSAFGPLSPPLLLGLLAHREIRSIRRTGRSECGWNSR